MEGPQFLRAYYRAEDGKKDGPLHFVASTEGVGRDGLVISAEAWELDNYQRNPVFLWVHDYTGFRTPMPVIGRVENLEVHDKQLEHDVVFDPDDEFAQMVERKYRNGFMNAVSVGWDTHEIKYTQDNTAPPTVTRAELLDISAVPVPGDPNALIERQLRAFRALLEDKDLAPDLDQGTRIDLRAGAVLSARNLEDLTSARDLIDAVLERAKKEEDDDRTADEPEIDLSFLSDLSTRLAALSAPTQE